MGFGNKPTPPAVPLPPPAAHPPTLANVLSKPRKDTSQKTTMDNTIQTSPQGLKTPPSTTGNTLLGQ